MMILAVYEFTCKGVTTEGNKATFVGEVIDLDDDRFPPMSACEKARDAVEKLSPGFKFDGDRMIGEVLKVKHFPTLRKLKGKTKALQKKLGQVPAGINP
jgi:hypothetical protein